MTVVRAFRPQVIVAVFTGTPRDGHGHHQVSGILAREAYDAAADTVRFPRSATLGLGAWTPAKFYRAQRFNAAEATLVVQRRRATVPFRGMTYAEIASESRSQHLSQGFGVLQRRGTSMDYVKLEASHVSPPIAPEKSMFETLGIGWGRFASAHAPRGGACRARFADGAIAEVRQRGEPRRTGADGRAAGARRRTARAARARGCTCPRGGCAAGCVGVDGDLALSLETAQRRAQRALLAAAGVLVEATAPRELLAVHDTLPVTVTVYNQGKSDVVLEGASVWMQNVYGRRRRDADDDRAGQRGAHHAAARVAVGERAVVAGERIPDGHRHVRLPTGGLTAQQRGDRRGSRGRHARARRAAHRGRVVRVDDDGRSSIASPIRRAASCVGRSRRCRRSA